MRHRHGRFSPLLALLLLLVVYLALGISYLRVTPLFENSDEWSHLSLVRYFIHQRAIPPRVLPDRLMDDGGSDEGVAWLFAYHDPPLYYAPPLYHALSAAFVSVWGLDLDDLPDMMIPSPAWEAKWTPEPGRDPRNKTIYAHQADETWAESDTVRAATLLRIASLGLGSVTVACTYLLAWLLLSKRAGRRCIALGAAMTVAFNPKFLSISAGVTNDNLLNAIFATFLVGALWLQQSPTASGSTWRGWAALGGLAGLGLMTKQSALLLLPVGALAIFWQQGGRRGPRWRRVVVDGLAFGVVALGVGGWWYLCNAVRYGDPLGLEPHFAVQKSLAGFDLSAIWMTLRSYWAAFGWAPILVAPWMYVFAGSVAVMALVGLVIWGWPTSIKERRGLLVLISALVLNVISFWRWSVATGAPTGRLLFPTLPVVGVLAARGLAWWGQRRWGRWALAGATAVALLCAAVAPRWYLRPAYASPRVPAAMIADATIQRVGEVQPLTFVGGVCLAGYEVGAGPVLGEPFDLTLYWHAETHPERQYRVWVQVAPWDPTERVAEDIFWLGGTRYPSDLWPAGDWVRQTHRLAIPEWAPAPALYWIRVGLLDETGTRVELADGSSDMVVLGPWRLRGDRDRGPGQVLPKRPVDFRLGAGIHLTGYHVEQADDGWGVTLYWRAEELVDVDYTVFVHLLDGDGQLLAQHDAPPRGGVYPTGWWLPGDVVPDQHTLSPEEPLEAAGLLVVGMYDSATKVRLPAYDETGERLPGDVIPLTKLPIEPDLE